MNNNIVTIFGGSGFVGRHIVEILASKGAIIRVAVRNPNRAKFLQPLGDVGQINFIKSNIIDSNSVDEAIKGSDHVVNLVGTFSNKGSENFNSIHYEGTKYISKACRKYNIKNFVHVSAIGADLKSNARYHQTKKIGEEAVMLNFPDSTILRPSIIFGSQDNFFNLFATIAQFTPVMPVFGDTIISYGKTLYQPVFVEDVAEAIVLSIEKESFKGNIYELGGPTVYSFKEIIEMILNYTGKRRFLIPFPYAIMNIVATFNEILPLKYPTRDQVKQMKMDNIVNTEALTFEDLGIKPSPVEAIVPAYLSKFKKSQKEI